MRIWIPRAIVLASACLAVGFGPGCSDTTNESEAGAVRVEGPAPPDAPKTQEEFARQQLAKYAKNAKAKKPARPAR